MGVLSQFADEAHQDWDQETGLPTRSHFANALQAWSFLQDRPTTVAEAALTFNAKPEIIRDAIEQHPWMFLDGDIIEHEGE